MYCFKGLSADYFMANTLLIKLVNTANLVCSTIQLLEHLRHQIKPLIEECWKQKNAQVGDQHLGKTSPPKVSTQQLTLVDVVLSQFQPSRLPWKGTGCTGEIWVALRSSKLRLAHFRHTYMYRRAETYVIGLLSCSGIWNGSQWAIHVDFVDILISSKLKNNNRTAIKNVIEIDRLRKSWLVTIVKI